MESSRTYRIGEIAQQTGVSVETLRLSFARIGSGGHLEYAAVMNRCGTPRRPQSNRDEHDWPESIDEARAARIQGRRHVNADPLID